MTKTEFIKRIRVESVDLDNKNFVVEFYCGYCSALMSAVYLRMLSVSNNIGREWDDATKRECRKCGKLNPPIKIKIVDYDDKRKFITKWYADPCELVKR